MHIANHWERCWGLPSPVCLHTLAPSTADSASPGLNAPSSPHLDVYPRNVYLRWKHGGCFWFLNLPTSDIFRSGQVPSKCLLRQATFLCPSASYDLGKADFNSPFMGLKV